MKDIHIFKGMEKLITLGNEYVELHDLVGDGCKSSCRSWSCGINTDLEYTFDPVQKLKYFFEFGGYCISTCSRTHREEAESIEELITKVKLIFKESRYEYTVYQKEIKR